MRKGKASKISRVKTSVVQKLLAGFTESSTDSRLDLAQGSMIWKRWSGNVLIQLKRACSGRRLCKGLGGRRDPLRLSGYWPSRRQLLGRDRRETIAVILLRRILRGTKGCCSVNAVDSRNNESDETKKALCTTAC
ncbi:hypothetical protein HBI36_223100 [Parastagonospora nodorum]|nr:hypothetical protein HBI36_223100 [Parastagonospora nodorum]